MDGTEKKFQAFEKEVAFSSKWVSSVPDKLNLPINYQVHEAGWY